MNRATEPSPLARRHRWRCTWAWCLAGLLGSSTAAWAEPNATAVQSATQPAPRAAPDPAGRPSAGTARTDADLVQQVGIAINDHRRAHHLPPLDSDAALADLAAGHSAWMAQRGMLDHDGFADRFRLARRSACVENLAAGFTRAASLVAGWRASPSHQRNLLDGRLSRMGLASVDGHVTWLACSGPLPPVR